jgi:hypothetical protein
MKELKVYLAHYGTTRFFERQTKLIRKYFLYNKNTTVLKIYGFVDSSNDVTSEEIRKKWLELNVIPIDLPRGRSSHFSESYALAFQFIYDYYIKFDKYISIFLENDIFPIDYIDVETYSKDYSVCGEIRFNTADLPDRMLMFYLGLQIFNHTKIQNKDMYSGISGNIIASSGNTHWIDCGGFTYYWLTYNDNYKTIKHIPTNGYIQKEYDPFISPICEVHNIENDIENLPEHLREGYHPMFRVVIYDNLFLHLELMGHDYDKDPIKAAKNKWFDDIFARLINR